MLHFFRALISAPAKANRKQDAMENHSTTASRLHKYTGSTTLSFCNDQPSKHAAHTALKAYLAHYQEFDMKCELSGTSGSGREATTAMRSARLTRNESKAPIRLRNNAEANIDAAKAILPSTVLFEPPDGNQTCRPNLLPIMEALDKYRNFNPGTVTLLPSEFQNRRAHHRIANSQHYNSGQVKQS